MTELPAPVPMPLADAADAGVRLQFVKEQLTFTGEDTAMATLLLSVMGRSRNSQPPTEQDSILLQAWCGALTGRAGHP